MSEHLSVEVIRADQVQEGDHVARLHDIATITTWERIGDGRPGWTHYRWEVNDGEDGGTALPDLTFLRVLSGEPSDAEVEALKSELHGRLLAVDAGAALVFSSVEGLHEILSGALSAARKARSGDA